MLVLLALEVVHVDLGVGVVAQERGVGEDEDDDGHEVLRPATEDVGDRCRGQGVGGAIGNLWGGLSGHRVVDPGEQDDEGGDGTHHDRVHEDAQGLHESLLDRVGDGGGGCDVGDRSLTGLVGEQASAGAVEKCGGESPGGPGEGLVDSEGALEDGEDRSRDRGDVQHQDGHGDEGVDHRHDRHEPLRDGSDRLDALEDDRRGDDNQCNGGHPRLDVEGALHRGGDGVGLGGLVGEAEDEGDDDGEELGGGLGPQAALDVVGRAAAEGAVGVGDLVELGEGGLDESGGHAHQRHDPHPEHGAGAAHGDGDGHAHDVAGAHAGGQPDGEGLEGGDPALLAVTGGGDGPHHVGEEPQLHESGPHGEVQASQHEQPGEQVEEQVPGGVIEDLGAIVEEALQECGPAAACAGCRTGQGSQNRLHVRSSVGVG